MPASTARTLGVATPNQPSMGISSVFTTKTKSKALGWQHVFGIFKHKVSKLTKTIQLYPHAWYFPLVTCTENAATARDIKRFQGHIPGDHLCSNQINGFLSVGWEPTSASVVYIRLPITHFAWMCLRFSKCFLSLLGKFLNLVFSHAYNTDKDSAK